MVRKGWYGDRARHSLAARGIPSNRIRTPSKSNTNFIRQLAKIEEQMMSGWRNWSITKLHGVEGTLITTSEGGKRFVDDSYQDVETAIKNEEDRLEMIDFHPNTAVGAGKVEDFINKTYKKVIR